MRFRTEIEPLRSRPIDADEHIVLLGSCFADNMGEQLRSRGLAVVHNPLGPLFNPVSVATALRRAADGAMFTKSDLVLRGNTWHALAWASRYQSDDPDRLLDAVNHDFSVLIDAVRNAGTIFITFGTSYIYRLLETGETVGNCHKLPAAEFSRERMGVDDIVALWQPLMAHMQASGKRLIFTVSPVRHVADGLHANNLSKATLLLSIESLGAEYFPAYEIVCDDLRDYRFYASDLKHPSESAVEYIYEKFADTYFSAATKEILRERRAAYLRAAHRPGNNTL